MWVTNSKAELMPIIQGKILEGSAVHTECWKAYDGLILNGSFQRMKFARGKCHVNGIESFRSFRRLAKFNGLTDKNFLLHLEDCELRFNHRQNKDLLSEL